MMRAFRLLALFLVTPIALGPLPEPREAYIRLADGTGVRGQITAWDADGLEGDFGRYAWTQLHTQSAWLIHSAFRDPSSVDDWLLIARAMLQMRDGRRHAEYALRWAGWLDPARQEEVRRLLLEAQQMAPGRDAGRLYDDPAWAAPPAAQSWSILNDAERAEAIQSAKFDVQSILKKAQVPLRLTETESFLLYSDMPHEKARHEGKRLDAAYRRVASFFGLPPQRNIFWGKAILLVITPREKYERIQRDSFGATGIREDIPGLLHGRGPKTFVVFHRFTDDDQLIAGLTHEMIHAFLHRYRTTRDLPPWLEEGLADGLAYIVLDSNEIDFQRRAKGLRFVRTGGPVDNILGMRGEDGTWPGPRSVGYAVSYLLIRWMIDQDPDRFVTWVNAVKDGKDWQRALEQDFGMLREQLVEAFVRHYTVNE